MNPSSTKRWSWSNPCVVAPSRTSVNRNGAASVTLTVSEPPYAKLGSNGTPMSPNPPPNDTTGRIA
jgi:hypothetical protein